VKFKKKIKTASITKRNGKWAVRAVTMTNSANDTLKTKVVSIAKEKLSNGPRIRTS
jgi:hypothetical protein